MLLRVQRRVQSRSLALALKTWADAAASAAARRSMVRQRLEWLHEWRVATSFNAWVSAANDLRRRRGLAQRAATVMRSRTLSAAFDGWADEMEAPAIEDEEDPSESQAITPSSPSAKLSCKNYIFILQN